MKKDWWKKFLIPAQIFIAVLIVVIGGWLVNFLWFFMQQAMHLYLTLSPKSLNSAVIKDCRDDLRFLLAWQLLPPSSGLSSSSTLKNMPTMQEMQVWSLGREDPLEEDMAAHSSILPGKIPWTEKGDYVWFFGVTKGQTWLRWLSTHVPLSLPLLKILWELSHLLDFIRVLDLWIK